MRKTLSILFAVALVLSFSLVTATPAMAQSWLAGWSHRVEITIDQTRIDDHLAGFPLLLYLSASSGLGSTDVSSIFDELGANRKKIAVTTSDGTTQCYVEIEKWDSVNEQAWLWVRVPNIASGGNTVLYLYYDNSKADNTTYAGDTGSTPAQNAWDSSFVGVWHKTDGPAQAILDSTSYANHGTKKGDNEPQEVAGRIGRAQNYDGTDDVITLPNIDLHSAHTIEGWLIRYGTQYGMFIAQRGSGGDAFQFYDRPSAMDDKLHYWNGTSIVDSNSSVSTGTWHYVVVVHNGSNALVFYLDGVADGSRTLSLGAQSTESILLQQNTVRHAKGLLDEVRFSSAARSAAWIKATYHSGNDSLLSYGSEESAAGCVTTATYTGAACFTVSHGVIENLTAVAPPGLPSVTFPHGMFSFKITGLTPGQTVTVTITLPGPVPVGTLWWKYDNGQWYSLPNLSDDGDAIMVIQLTDGGSGDLDGIANGIITDPGGPGNPMTVGWETSPISKASVLAPWIALLAAIIAGAGLLVMRRRRAQI